MLELKRVCGTCTACCKTHSVSSIDKRAGSWCIHCKPGKGCLIYPDRPNQCRDFRCEWLKGFGDESDRPDKVKYVLDFVAHAQGPKPGILQIWEASEGSLSRTDVRMLTSEILDQMIWVSHLYLSGRRKLFFPRGKVMTPQITELMKKEGFELGEL